MPAGCLPQHANVATGQLPVTNGEARLTSGGKPGTSGEAPRVALLAIAAVITLSLVVDVSSELMESRAQGRALPAWRPLLLEGSSGIFMLLLAPLVWRGLQRWPLAPPWWRSVLVHLGLSIPFSLAHVAGMVGLRFLVFSIAGLPYSYFDGALGLALLYEWRKDALTYLMMLALFWTVDRIRHRAAPAGDPERRLALRTGTGTVHLLPSEIRVVEAAGNYVEFDAAGRRHLVRMTLAEAGALLGPAFLRVHRSRLVNRSLIRAERRQPSGDVLLDLADGSVVVASRRYRDRLPSAGSAGPSADGA